ncbi:MAG TPA: FRG domain-containing protein, partial [Sedimentisphaerales bacterium]
AADMHYENRLAKETAIIVKFCELAKEFCDDTEKGYLQGPVPQDRIKALPILQHYNAPTRLLDWTANPLIALYFAAIHHHNKDGAIWWFKRNAFYDEVGKRWEKHGLRRHPEQDDGIDLNDTAFNTDGPPWISELNCLVPFPRIRVQQGFFTIAGRLGFEHGVLIADVLKKEDYGRIIIPNSWKQQILDRLRTVNIHSRSIDYPGADLVGIHLTQELKI